MADNRLGTWSVPGQTQTAGTAIKIGIPPWRGPNGAAPLVYGHDSQGKRNWMDQGGVFTKISNYSITTGGTAHLGYFLRPLNYALVTVAGAANGTTFTIGTDPGLYTTAANWKFPGTPYGVATNAIAANDYFAVQLTDGTWFFDKVSSMSTLQVTTTTTIPNITGGGIPVGAIMFFYGIQTDLDPRLGAGSGHINVQPNVSVFTQFYDQNGLISTLGPGEPMYYFNANATAADTVASISGFFSRN